MVTLNGDFKRLFGIAAAIWAIYLLFLFPALAHWRANLHYGGEVAQCRKMYVSDDETVSDAVALRACREEARASAGSRAYSGLDFDLDEGERWSLERYYAHTGPKLIGMIASPLIAAYAAGWVFCWITQGFAALCLRMRQDSGHPR